jgi:transglutaminase-like putative cysteine protease
MFYAIRHFTRFRYSRPISQSMMEVRMHPRSEGSQRCFTFQLSVNPKARIFSYSDHVGNLVHHFDLPLPHQQLTIIVDALVNMEKQEEVQESLGPEAWNDLDAMVHNEDHWEMLMPSRFARTSPELAMLAQELGFERRDERDPLETLRAMSTSIYESFDYVKQSTAVHSPIETALESRRGVCQDFAHIMTTMTRNLRIPCRYVSGYMYHTSDHEDRSSEGATHAWVEALLPGLGWVGFDPTNNLLARERHIRTAVGRDYADVPPTAGTLKGSAETELQVRVRITPSEAVLPPDQEFAADQEWSQFLQEDRQAQALYSEEQQHQQQQQ